MALNSRSAYFACSKIAPQQPMQDFGHVSMEAALGRCCRRAGIEEGDSQGRLGLPPSGGGVVQATTTLRRETLAIPPSARIAGRLTSRETGASLSQSESARTTRLILRGDAVKQLAAVIRDHHVLPNLT